MKSLFFLCFVQVGIDSFVFGDNVLYFFSRPEGAVYEKFLRASKKSEVCSNPSRILCAESKRLNRCFDHLKNTPHSLKGDFGGVMHKNFSFSEKSAHYSKINRCICLCGRCVSASTQCGYWLFCVLEKYPLIPLREKSRGVSGKSFVCLRKSLLCPNQERWRCSVRR